MEYLQYLVECFIDLLCKYEVLNLVINGIPSIQNSPSEKSVSKLCFKPCYKWNTFNTVFIIASQAVVTIVLNLVINGIPSIRDKAVCFKLNSRPVLNLVINGIPSIQKRLLKTSTLNYTCFKPCYKWNTFNTK